ncbi:glycosyltransferase [Ectothiorhodospira lacustris]|uniref:glycosyltransferase n=1 Tax=Ectothiorhodospira lacustris TaxID=2899127 RepID=UPI001EE797A4|nr:glycosyltransferase [Ectothiorhodospira lacustris]MCG5521161.1 glycosyltransferase [Ectothiorhodospira lacustris]
MHPRKRSLRIVFFIVLCLLILLVGYKLYLSFFKAGFEALHVEQLERIETTLAGRESFSFAVVGNINNSIGLFERRMIPVLNRSDLQFMISAGNAVSGGGEDNYQAIYGTLGRLQIPYLLTFGETEHSEFGSFRFYDYFGPYFFSFSVGEAGFIFLDVTGKTPHAWQRRWLEGELESLSRNARHLFVFLGEPILPEQIMHDPDAFRLSEQPAFRADLLRLFEHYGVDAVFSASLPIYDRRFRDGSQFVVTGGGGGLLSGDEGSYHHFVRVDVGPEGVGIRVVPVDPVQNRVLRLLENLWFIVYSLFYVGYVNFLLLVCVVILVAIRLYRAIFVEKNYYRDFELDDVPPSSRPLRVMMFTNNYLPFIGGVPISIQRLVDGLTRGGAQVRVVAPCYGEGRETDPRVLRVSTWLAWGEGGSFRLANPLSLRLFREARAFRPDIIHVHHPFWLGSLGLWLGRRLKVPVVYTYHTRLEHFAHYVPVPGLLFRNLISHYLVERFGSKCDGVIVPTLSTEEYLHVIGVRSQILVKPTGVDVKALQTVDKDRVDRLRRRHAPADELLLVTVSRLSKEKNIDFLLQGVAWVRRHTAVAFSLLIIGEGPERGHLEQRCRELALSGTVTLVGAVPPDAVTDYYHLADVFVFASQAETQGMVILEAMAAGLPVVAVRSSGIDDVVQNDINGYKTGEHPAEWGERLQTVLEDAVLRARLSAQARRFARQYDMGRVSEDVALFYRRLIMLAERRRNAA